MPTITDERKKMESFLSGINAEREARERDERYKHSRPYVWAQLGELKRKGINRAAEGVFLNIYRGGLPLTKEYKDVYAADLDRRALQYVAESGDGDVYSYLEKAAKKGSVPAKTIIDKVTAYMDAEFNQYYQEDVENVNTELIDTEKDSNIVSAVTAQVTSDMSVDEVSDIIADNVKATISKEMQASKEEDERLAELEANLIADDTVMTEEAIDDHLAVEGYGNTIFKPTLFNGIMIGEVAKLQKSGMEPGEELQQKAFYESVQELTLLQTLQTLDCIDINVNNIDQIASNYASGSDERPI